MHHSWRDNKHISECARAARLVIGGVLLCLAAGQAPAQTTSETPDPRPDDADSAQAQQYTFDIASQPLLSALGEFTEVTRISVVRPDNHAISGQAPGVRGEMSADRALTRLLSGTELRFEYRDPRTVVLTAPTVSDEEAVGLRAIDVVALPDNEGYGRARSVSTLTRDEIDRRPPRHAAQMLEEIAGAYSMFSEQDPALSVNIRGMQDFGRVNMMIDGARQNFQISGHQQRNGQMYIDPELLAEVQVDKGPSSGVHGAGAIAGSANFRTIGPYDVILPGNSAGLRLRGTTGLGEYANGTEFIGSAAAAYATDSFDVLLARSGQEFGEYEPGDNGELGTDRRVGDSDRQKQTAVRESGRSSRSTLAKIGVMPTDFQRFELSYLDTGMEHSSSRATFTEFNQGGDTLYERTGSNDVTSRTSTLGYEYAPPTGLVDLSAQLYYVTTYMDQERSARGSSYIPLSDCKQYYDLYDPIPSWVSGYCTPAYETRYRTNTWGLELENTSQFLDSARHDLSANYGIEGYTDETESEAEVTDSSLNFEASPIGGLTTTTPEGERDSVSAFTDLSYTYADTIELGAGLRYDYYNLRGHTGFDVPGHATGDGWPREYSYDIDRTFEHTSPTLSAAVQVTDWLQPYARWGESWRMPAITETLITGGHVGDTVASTQPNPYLDPEKSETWEAGVNIQADRLFTERDALRLKVNYFDTRVDDFIYMSFSKQAPHQTMAGDFQMAYDNSAKEVRFRGTEFKLEYDAGFWYAGLNYTNMIGDNKDNLCSSYYYLGTVYDRPNPPAANCAVFGSAEYPPPDKLSAHTGVRLLDQQVDIGIKVRHAEGFNESREESLARGEEYAFPPVWDDYTVWDFYSSYQPNEHMTLRLTVDNVLDRAYLAGYGDPLDVTLGRGRTVQGSMELRF
ncbi:TonB-dependent hemoglobin/transferrin/lactoferrin family receptor [Aquisalimonas lutea]|uniref:TonB-dependent receptor n=1 Tax=Aquisalimonas lutea TaxID=1327750 RepID=UPI0025B3DEE7|nr:TonB-dependent receptor [Aquisalimonas lutea]MDN3518489.1 TonB-dependent hemoglobin/transferrin/lactoferrin family receptor [Aquisalimonas lutea]